MAQLARNSGPHLAAQILLYPVLDLDMDRSDRYPSLCENAEGYHVTRDEPRWCVRNYLPAGMDPADPRISPARHADLTGQSRGRDFGTHNVTQRRLRLSQGREPLSSPRAGRARRAGCGFPPRSA